MTDDLADLLKDLDPAALALARQEQQEYEDRLTAARRGQWRPELPEPPDGTILMFEVDTDLYALRRSDLDSAHGGYPYGPGGVTWCEFGRSVPISWAVACATWGEEALAAGVRLVLHSDDAYKELGWKSRHYVRMVLANAAAYEAERMRGRDPK